MHAHVNLLKERTKGSVGRQAEWQSRRPYQPGTGRAAAGPLW